MRKTTLAGAAAAAFAATLAFATPASAAVTIDWEANTGFVGKGDVQTAFTWNNKQAQDNAKLVSFTYEINTTYKAICSFATGEGTNGYKVHDVNHPQKRSVEATVAYDARLKNQYTGYNLTFGPLTTTGTSSLPEVGGACPGNPGHDGVWTSVEVDPDKPSSGGLYVHWNGQSVFLPETPVAATV